MLMARFRCCFVVEMGRFSIHPNEWVLEVIQPADTSVGRTLLLLRSGYDLLLWFCCCCCYGGGFVMVLSILLRVRVHKRTRHVDTSESGTERSAKFPTCVAAWVLLCLAKSLMYVTFSEKRCFPVWLFYAVLPLP